MCFLRRLILLPLITCWLLVNSAAATATHPDFKVWLENFRVEAQSAGISQKTLTAAFAGMNGPLSFVLELDRRQPEFTQSLKDYVATRVGGMRVAMGRTMLNRYPTWLGRVGRTYGVPKQFIVALWGIETNYGAHSGSTPVIHSLATLAHDGRRSAYFRKELLDALHIIEDGQISLKRMKGSWAGAMGQCQFMPSSFRSYAVDADGDGRVNIWGSVPDVLASAANYLNQMGWQDGQPWGHLVKIPQPFDLNLAGLDTRFLLTDWQDLGLRMTAGTDLPQVGLFTSLLLPDGPNGPAYLVFDNFRVLLKWNKSNAFAIAVGTLADRLSE